MCLKVPLIRGFRGRGPYSNSVRGDKSTKFYLFNPLTPLYEDKQINSVILIFSVTGRCGF